MLTNWVFQETNGGGMGDILLSSSVAGYIALNSVLSDQTEFFYVIEDGTSKETGIGRYIAASNKVTRVRVLETLTSGVYDNTSPSPLNISSNARLMLGNSVQALTTTVPLWKETVAQLTLPPVASNLAPDYTELISGISGLGFKADAKSEVGLRFNLNTDLKPNSTLIPNIRWSPTTSDAGIVRWGLTLSIASLGDIFISTGTTFLEQEAGGVLDVHLMIEAVSGTLTGVEPNSVVIGKLFRDATHANDNYSGDAILHSVGLSYMSDHIGTPKKNSDHYNWG